MDGSLMHPRAACVVYHVSQPGQYSLRDGPLPGQAVLWRTNVYPQHRRLLPPSRLGCQKKGKNPFPSLKTWAFLWGLKSSISVARRDAWHKLR